MITISKTIISPHTNHVLLPRLEKQTGACGIASCAARHAGAARVPSRLPTRLTNTPAIPLTRPWSPQGHSNGCLGRGKTKAVPSGPAWPMRTLLWRCDRRTGGYIGDRTRPHRRVHTPSGCRGVSRARTRQRPWSHQLPPWSRRTCSLLWEGGEGCILRPWRPQI